jgi:hypothetical protein
MEAGTTVSCIMEKIKVLPLLIGAALVSSAVLAQGGPQAGIVALALA